MDLNLLNNSIIICDNNVKKFIIKNTKFLNVTFKTFDEACDDILGYYDDLVFDISKNKSINPYISKNIFDSFRIVEKNISSKLDEAVELKEHFNDSYNYVKPINYKKVYVINYYFNNNVFNKALTKINYKLINLYDANNVKTTLYKANNRYDEVFYVFNEIAKLLDKNETDIYIKAPGDYNLILKEYSDDFNIDVDINDSYNLFTLPETMQFINNSSGIVREDITNLVKENNLYRPIINKLNELNISDYNTQDVMEYLIYLFKTINIEKDKYNNVIKVTNDIPLNAKHVFILGFNQGITPKIYQDTNYISDNEYKKLGLKTSLDMNVYEKKRMKDLINNIYNVYLSNSKSHNGKSLEQSLFLNEIEYEEIKIDYDIVYSKKALEKLTAIMLDDYYKYNDEKELLSKLYNTTHLKYNSYDNTFKANVNYEVKDLSYSKIDTYIRCPFEYYLKYVLNLSSPKTDNINIGLYFHKILEVCKDPLDVDKVSDDIFSEYFNERTNKKTYMVNIYNKILKILIEQFNKFLTETNYTQIKKEIEVDMPFLDFNFTGKVDLILSNGANAMLVDYKTGSVNLNLNELEYGVNMQLPIYMMMLEYLGYDVKGVFIKKLLPSLRDDLKIDEMVYDDSKLNGYYTNNLNALSEYHQISDTNIKTLKLKKDDTFDSYSMKRALSDEEIKTVINVTKEKITEIVNNMRNGKFEISPYIKTIKDEFGEEEKEDSCKYCSFNDICYKRRKNFRKLSFKDDLSIIGRGGSNEVE